MGKLTVVATPIGNVLDLSPRAIESLKHADVICAEDTRHTRPLLDRVGVGQVKMLSVHAHNERERGPEVAALLEQGLRVCFVSDAGCPGVSDPGGHLVEAVVAAGHEIEVLPGPSALTAALMGAGIDVSRFAFLGFLARKGKDRERMVKASVEAGFGVVIYEAANRTDDLLKDLFEWCGARRVVVARELTKMHETFHRGVLGQAVQPPLVEKGEVVVVVEAGEVREHAAVSLDVQALSHDASLSPKEKARRLAAAQGISVREAYARVQAAQQVDGVGEVKRALGHLAEAAQSLLLADDTARAARQMPTDESAAAGSDIVGADALLKLLSRPSSLGAPVEAGEAVRAVLAALSAVDALHDALTADDDDA